MSSESGDSCRPVAVTGDDGEPVTIAVCGSGPLTADDIAALGEITRAVQRRYRAEHPSEAYPAE